LTDPHGGYDPLLETTDNRKQLELIFYVEGEFKNGYANGYARRFYKDHECQVGYWKDS
jgi:hypothetical protein